MIDFYVITNDTTNNKKNNNINNKQQQPTINNNKQQQQTNMASFNDLTIEQMTAMLNQRKATEIINAKQIAIDNNAEAISIEAKRNCCADNDDNDDVNDTDYNLDKVDEVIEGLSMRIAILESDASNKSGNQGQSNQTRYCC